MARKIVSIGYPIQSFNSIPKSVLLAVRQRGIGTGKYMGYGGEEELLRDNQDPVATVINELNEESGLICSPEEVAPAGVMDVTYISNNGKREYVQSEMTIYINLIHDWIGTPRCTEEMKYPSFFSVRHLPVAKMLEGDARVLRRILGGFSVDAQVTYRLPNLELIAFSMTERLRRLPWRR